MELTRGPVAHRVSVHDLDGWLQQQLGWRPSRGAPTVRDWLAMPQQRLAGVTAGKVFRDDDGALTSVREQLGWYPEPVWRYLLACQWQRISQEEAFVGRCAEVGDQLGSALVAGRLVRDLVHLCLLLERRYAPYLKWLGSAFRQLDLADALLPSLQGTLAARDFATCERHLCSAYLLVATKHNESGLTEPIDPSSRSYFGRPYLVLHAERFARALQETINHAGLRALPLTGSVDQWADSTDLIGEQAAIQAAVSALGATKPG